jgi:DNA (cytosine-5)-methyltransferase 1
MGSVRMNYLSLFSGAGGGDLAFQHLLGFNCVGYVEYENYCQKLIKQRISDGLLDAAPIFGDIRKFNSENFAAAYSGLVDVVSGGFPCQPFSVSGKQLGEGDERNMWPETIRTIRIIRPEFAFLENVTGLLVSGYAGTVFGDLAECGYNARWCVLGNHFTGGISDGKRLWIVATTSHCAMLESVDIFKHFIPCQKEPCRREHTRAISAALSQDDYTGIKRNPDAVARGMERLKAIGNGQVPAVAEAAFRILSGKLTERKTA